MNITFDINGGLHDCKDILALDLRLTDGTPCDSFEATLPYTVKLRDAGALCSKIQIHGGGALLLTGTADDYEVVRGRRGSYVVVSGRGMASTLMSRECEASHFDAATLSDIQKRYITPNFSGTVDADISAFTTVRGFETGTGESVWQALRNFCAYSAQINPRFGPAGNLVLQNKTGGKSITIDDCSPVVSAHITVKRQGIRDVTLFERTTGSTMTLTDESLRDAGFLGSRTIAVPRSGIKDYVCRANAILRQERRERRKLELVLAQPFFAMPCDIIALSLSNYPIGDWTVSESRTTLDGGTATSTLICYPKD